MPFGQLTSSSPGRRSGVSVWRQIADTLTTEIRDRVYTDTGRLPGEVELSARFCARRWPPCKPMAWCALNPAGAPLSSTSCWTTPSQSAPASVRTCCARACCPASSSLPPARSRRPSAPCANSSWKKAPRPLSALYWRPPTARWSFLQLRRDFWPCFSCNHSPAPKTFKPVLSIRMCAGSAGSTHCLEIDFQPIVRRLTVL